VLHSIAFQKLKCTPHISTYVYYNSVCNFIAFYTLGMLKLLFLISIIKKHLRVSWLWDLMTQTLPKKRRILRRSVIASVNYMYGHCGFAIIDNSM